MVRSKNLMMMDHDAIKAHWQDWAKTYGTSLRATTKTSSAKRVELDALVRAFRRVLGDIRGKKRVFEAGCGNGQNCLYLAEVFPTLSFLGADYVNDMVDAARKLARERAISEDRACFFQRDILELGDLGPPFDVIFTDRCLINLNTDELQKQALTGLCRYLKPGGYLIMIENSVKAHEQQNDARKVIGLEPRKPASFNHFLNEEVICSHLVTQGMKIEEVEDFISLHDLVLYVLVPFINDGEINYDHPLVHAATELNIAFGGGTGKNFGSFGQNRLFLCRQVG